MDKVDKYSNIFEYIKWRSDLTFQEREINDLDLMIFSQIVFLDYNNIVSGIDSNETISFKDAYNKFKHDESKSANLGLIIPSDVITMSKMVSKSNRYGSILLSDYVDIIDDKTDEQSSFITIKISKDTYVIAFSGTDDTITGWVEDLRMIHTFPTKSEDRSKKYVEAVMDKYKDGKFYLCGHSKGGNLTIYSTLTIGNEYFNRVIKAVSFDGPGINKKIDDKIFDENRISKLTSIMPTGSMIGILFNHKENIKIVKSYQNGAYQHDVFSWQINSKCDFEYDHKFNDDAVYFKCRIDTVLDGMTYAEKVGFVDGVKKVLSAKGTKTLSELMNNIPSVLDVYFKLSREERKYIFVPITKLSTKSKVIKNYIDTVKGFLLSMKDNKKRKDIRK